MQKPDVPFFQTTESIAPTKITVKPKKEEAQYNSLEHRVDYKSTQLHDYSGQWNKHISGSASFSTELSFRSPRKLIICII